MQQHSNFLIYLASASPRRSALLEQIGVAHRVRPVHVDEDRLPGELPARYVERLARHKAQTLWDALDSAERRPVLGADTTVALGAEILGKPADEAEGIGMLERLSGRTHEVFTAVALCSATGCASRVNVSEVTFRETTAEERSAYWRTGEPADKAGGYAVQGRAAVFIQRVCGSYSGVMGLPLYETGELLAGAGWRCDGSSPQPASREPHARVHG